MPFLSLFLQLIRVEVRSADVLRLRLRVGPTLPPRRPRPPPPPSSSVGRVWFSLSAAIVFITLLSRGSAPHLPQDGGGGGPGVPGRRRAAEAGDFPPSRRLSHRGKHDRFWHFCVA